MTGNLIKYLDIFQVRRETRRNIKQVNLEINNMADPLKGLPDDYPVTSQAFTKQTYRDVYPAIDPSNAALSQEGKIVIVTGAGRGIGKEV